MYRREPRIIIGAYDATFPIRAERPLGRPAAARARPVERGGGARRLDHRRRHLPDSRDHRRPRPRAAADVRRVDPGRPVGAVRRAHVRRACGAVPPLGRRVRVHPGGLRPAARVSVRLDGAAPDPRLGPGRDRDPVRRVLAALARPGPEDRAQRHVRALRGGGRDRRDGDAELHRGALELAHPEPDDRDEVRRAGAARGTGVFRGAGGLRPLHPGWRRAHPGPVRSRARVGALGVRRLGRLVLRRWGSA